MISIKDGKLYQWDTGRVVMCTPPDGMWIDEIHLDNYTTDNTINLDTYVDGDYVCANIPDVVLQRLNPINIYTVMKVGDDEKTIESKTFNITYRKKPEDYVYEEEEILRYSKLEEQINALNEKVDNLDIPEVEVDDSLSEESTNPIQNKVVTEAVQGLEKKIDDIEIPEVPQTDEALSETSTNPIQNKAVTKAIKAVEEKVEAVDLSKKFTAVPGQVVRVKAVDEKGNPTEWEATDITSGEENVQSDLAENDENSAAYVKNRTHWVEEKIVLPEMEIDAEYFQYETNTLLSEGDKAVVVLDGVEYNSTVDVQIHGEQKFPIILGTRECPFDVIFIPQEYMETFGFVGVMIVPGFDYPNATAKMEIKGGSVVHKLDEKFIPDSVKVQADFSQNDETAPDYIKNRTHWVEEKIILSETNVVRGPNGVEFSYVIEEGKTYTIKFNGEIYNCKAKSSEIPETLTIGNASLMIGDNTGEPFCIGATIGDTEGGMVFNNLFEDTTVSIVLEEIHPLSPKFLPNGGVTRWDDLDGRPFYSEYEETEILPETQAQFVEEGMFLIPQEISLVVGGTYIVNWNGTEYTSVCVETDTPTIGNIDLMTGTGDTGEPFIIGVIPPEAEAEIGFSGLSAYALDGATELTLSITGTIETVHQLEEKYLPDSQFVINLTPSDSNASELKSDKTFTKILRAIKLNKNVVAKFTINDDSALYYLESYSNESIEFFRIIPSSSEIHYQRLQMFETDLSFTITVYKIAIK